MLFNFSHHLSNFIIAGDEFTPEALLAPSSMYTSDALPLVGCIEPIVNDTVVPRGSGDVKEFLGIEPKTVSLEQVSGHGIGLCDSSVF